MSKNLSNSPLARALETLAQSSPAGLDLLLDPYVDLPHDTIAYLVLRAWAAAPEIYAERLATYLAADPRRLKVGYSSWGSEGAGPGVASNYRSIEAVRAASTLCSLETLRALEAAIVNLTDEWEAKHPQTRGLRQLQLLAATDQMRLGPESRAMLAQLQVKFPEATQEAPRAATVHTVRLPIPAHAQEKMTDAQWLSAMAKYTGVRFRHDRPIEESGGEHQMATMLEEHAKKEPKRFIALTRTMPDNSPPAYFNAIIRGVENAGPPGDSVSDSVAIADVVGLVERVHALPGRPCGRTFVNLVEKWKKVNWPPSFIEAVTWYATQDPDPAEERWRKPASRGRPPSGYDVYTAGINSTRGSAARAVAQLLFDDHARANTLQDAIDHLAQDPSVAVRSCAVEPLTALLNTRVDLAISWFIKCVELDPLLLATPPVEHFVYHAGRRDYAAVRPVLQQMLASTEGNVVEAAAKVCCLLALVIEGAEEDAERVRTGTVAMRSAAATVYATNVTHNEVGATCRRLLRASFADPEDAVRSNAAKAFGRITKLETGELRELLEAFLDANPGAAALGRAFMALEKSPVRLPDLVCRLVEAGVREFITEAGDIATGAAGIGRHISKIAIRLYADSEDDETVRNRCLEAIDRMEMARFVGLSGELEKLER